MSSRQTIHEEIDGVVDISQENQGAEAKVSSLWCHWQVMFDDKEYAVGNNADDERERHAQTHECRARQTVLSGRSHKRLTYLSYDNPVTDENNKYRPGGGKDEANPCSVVYNISLVVQRDVASDVAHRVGCKVEYEK